jgi:hypothetical protein
MNLFTVMSQSLQSDNSFLSTDDLEIIESPYSVFEQVRDPEHRSRSFLLYNSNFDKDWFIWWNKTTWRERYPQKSIAWDISKLQSDVWKLMKPCASIQDGKPWVHCTRCNAILAHPAVNVKHSAGSSTLKRHPFTSSCQKTAKVNGQQKLDPSMFSKKQVRY